MGLFEEDTEDSVPVIHIRCNACGYEGVTTEEPMIEAEAGDELSDVMDEPEHCPRCGVPIVYEEDMEEGDVYGTEDDPKVNGVKTGNARKRRTGTEDYGA